MFLKQHFIKGHIKVFTHDYFPLGTQSQVHEPSPSPRFIGLSEFGQAGGMCTGIKVKVCAHLLALGGHLRPVLWLEPEVELGLKPLCRPKNG